MTSNKTSKRKTRSGFTMVELMAMLIIIGLLATLVVTKVASKIDQARVTTTKANLKALHAHYLILNRIKSAPVSVIPSIEH